MDLCALLSNALDNALEACRKLPEKKRRVALCIRADKGMLVLRLENPCAEPARRVGKKFLSSKPDPERHGIGTESIRSVVRKYGGSVSFSERDSRFEVLLYIPIQTQRANGMAPGPERE